MPLIAIAHILVALYFGVHAIRTGRNMYWLMVLFAFPLLGSVVYFFAEYLPEVRHSRVARKAVGTVATLVDPGRDVRRARADVERTPSVDNRWRLAEALLQAGQHDEALQHYEQCVAGPYARDPKLRLALANAQCIAGQHAQAVQTLERLFADEPERQAGEASLWYALALAEVAPERAGSAFELAMQRHLTVDTRCEYGLFLLRHGQPSRARQLLEEVIKHAKLGTAHSRDLHRPAIDRARAALKSLEEIGGASA
jgi:hypothetical protein